MNKQELLTNHPELAREIYNDGIMAAITKSGCGMNKSAFDHYAQSYQSSLDKHITGNVLKPKGGTMPASEMIHTSIDLIKKGYDTLKSYAEVRKQYEDQKAERERKNEPSAPKPEYEILEFKDTENNRIWGRTLDDRFIFEGNIWHYDLFLRAILDGKGSWSIHKVRRLSDGEVFTVGEKDVKFGSGIHNSGTIAAFELEKSCLKVRFDAGAVCGYFDLSDLQKPERKALFTTEDGVNVYAGDIFYVISPTTWNIEKIEAASHFSANVWCPSFSARENAEIYIWKHKPVLSWADFYLRSGLPNPAMSKELEQLAKERSK